MAWRVADGGEGALEGQGECSMVVDSSGDEGESQSAVAEGVEGEAVGEGGGSRSRLLPRAWRALDGCQ